MVKPVNKGDKPVNNVWLNQLIRGTNQLIMYG